MRTTCMKAFILALLITGFGLQSAKAGSILRIFYDGIPGSTVANLVNATNSAGQPVFPNGPNPDGSPLQSEWINDVFEGRPPAVGNGAENYGSMMEGYLEAPQDGAYTFFISSDDSSELWLGTNHLASSKLRIASVNGYTGYRVWDAQASQKSAAITLVKGQKYYVQVLHKEGGGGDHVSVGWQLPDGTLQRPMPLYYVQMSPINYYADPTILQQPMSTNVVEGRVVTLYVNVNATPPVSYQWFKNGQPISGAVLSSYSFRAALADSGSRFNIQVSGKTGVLVSKQAEVVVEPDTVAPSLVSVASVGDPNVVSVTFDEAISPATAYDVLNYSLDKGAEIYAAVKGVDDKTVLLYTSPLKPENYSLTVSGLMDLSSYPNTIAPTTRLFPVAGGYVQYKIYTGITGTTTNLIPTNPKYLSGVADMTGTSSSFETPWNIADNYIGQLRAWLTPPVTGDYVFSVFSDDASILYLSTDDNPANKKSIAMVVGWTNSKEYTKEANQKSAPIRLEANKKYYIEVANKEGTGGDGLGAGWQMPGAPALVNNDPAIPGKYLTAIKTFGPVAITNQLKSVTVAEAQPVTLSIGVDGVDGMPPYYYQWYKNGEMIAGATGTAYSISKVSNADNGGIYTVLVRNNFSITASSNAVLTVTPDTTAPKVLAAGITNAVVSVAFSEPVTSVTATNPANYSLKTGAGAAVAITGVSLLDSSNVQLITAELTLGTAYNLTVTGVRDQSAAGNAMAATTVPVTVYNFLGVQRINNTQAYGVVPAADGKLEITAGGADIWGTADQFVYAYRQVTGNFDYRVRVHSMTLADPWSKAGVMVRANLNAGSQNLMLAATPPGPTGHNSGTGLYSYQWRTNENSASESFSTPRPSTSYPNVWTRLQRAGNVFTAYYSTNGTDWILIQTKDNTLTGLTTNTVYIGVAVTSHTTGATTKAVISDFGQVPIIPPAFTANISNTTVEQMRTATFSVAVTGSGPFTYQWQRNGVNIAGATSPSYTTPRLAVADNGSKYKVVVTNPYGTSITSTEATLTVTPDVTAPNIASAGVFDGGNNITVAYSEELDSVLAQNVANYEVVGSPATVTGAALRPDNKTVIVSVSEPITNEVSLIVKAISDLANNIVRLTNNPVLIPMISQDIGTVNTNGVMTDPIQPGVAYGASLSDFEVLAGGSDIWNNADGFHFVYQAVQGDFDVRVRVESLQYVSDNWAKAGLMVRESADAGSRNLNSVVDPAAGANVWEFNYRATNNAASAGIPGASAVGPVTYPNAWIRIYRLGNTFTFLRSVDGVIWEQRAVITPSPAYPDVVQVGMATTAHNNTAGKFTRAVYRQYLLSGLVFPTITGITGSGNMKQIVLTFSEPLQAASATDIANYAVSGGLTVTGATLDSTGRKVTLTTSTQGPGELYTVTVNNVKGVSGLTVEQDTRMSFSGWVLSRGVVVREVWNGIANPLTNLKASPKYPNSPDTIGYLSKFEAPTDVADNYSQRVYAYLLPPVTGDYTFHIASDDQSELYLSTDENPANKQLIASVSNWTSSREYTAPTDRNETKQHSAPIRLEANKPYYIEALMSEGGGGDNLAVAWMLPGQTGIPANGSDPISGLYLANFANPDLAVLSIDQQPADVTVETGRAATFSVQVYSSMPSVLYQWQRLSVGSTTWLDIAGANNASYTTPLLAISDSGVRYRVAVYIAGAAMMSDEAVATVIPDSEVPKMDSVATFFNSKTITVRYNERMNATAGSLANYAVFGGPILTGVTLQSDALTAVLTVDRAITNQVVVYAENVQDLAGNSTSLLAICRFSTLQARDVGTTDASGNFTDPIQPGKALITGVGKYEIEAGGSDIWNNSDGFHFIYREVTGDFDVKVRVEDVRYVSDNWAKGGLMVRESLAGNSRNLNSVVDPTKGANVWEYNYRETTGGASAGIPGASAVGPVTYPNAWIRFNRQGNTFTIFRSSNGTTWEQRAQISPDPAYPATAFVGMVATAHNNTKGTNTLAKFADFQLTTP